MEDATFEKIYAQVWKMGNSLIITIPKDLAKFEGIEAGDYLRVWLKKQTVALESEDRSDLEV